MSDRLERALQLIELALERGSFRFGAAVDLLAPISTATVARHLQALTAAGMLDRLADGGYAIGPRHAAWGVGHSPAERHPLSDVLTGLSTRLQCTVAFWTVHGPRIRCRHRVLDEHSPSLSTPGNFRPISLPTLGTGLLMSEDVLTDLDALRQDIAWAKLQPDDRTLHRIATDCLRRRLYDDRAAFWTGSRRLAVLTSLPDRQPAIIGIGLIATRLRRLVDREPLVHALQQSAEVITTLPQDAFDF